MKNKLKKINILLILFISLIIGLKDVKALTVSNTTDFINALETSEVEEIKLGDDIEITDDDLSGNSINMPIENVDRTIDLNGFNLTSSVTTIGETISVAFFNDDRTLIITDSSTTGKISYNKTMFLISSSAQNSKFVICKGIFENDNNNPSYFLIKEQESLNDIKIIVNSGTFYYRNNAPFTDGFIYTIKNMKVFGVNQTNFVGFYNGTTGTLADVISENSDIYLNGDLYEEERTNLARNIYFEAGEGNGIEIKSRKNIYTVTFETNCEDEIASQGVEDGGLVQKPSNPVNGTNVFVGWYTDTTLTTEFDFTTPITSNTTIYAKWEERKIDISVDSNTVDFGELDKGFTEDVERKIKITNTGNIDVSISIEKSGSELLKNKALMTSELKPNESLEITLIADKDDPSKDVEGNYEGKFTITAYPLDEGEDHKEIEVKAIAKVVDNNKTYTVKFISADDGTEISSQIVKRGHTISIPNEPTRENYKFSGWFEDQTLTTPFDFTLPIIIDESENTDAEPKNADVVIYAKWLRCYTVTFVSEFLPEEQVPVAQQVVHGDYIGAPAPDEYGDYILEGYYLDSDYMVAYNGDPVTSDLTLYIKYRKINNLEEIKEINLEFQPPKIGNTVEVKTINKDGYEVETQTNLLQIIVPTGANYSLSNDYVDTMNWIKGLDEDELFAGTFEKDKEYYAEIYLESANGYKFAPDCIININGKPTGVITYYAENYNGIYMNVVAKVVPVENVVEYKILNGDNQTYFMSSNEDLVVRADGDIQLFKELQIDSKTVSKENYTLESGSTIVTVKASYLNTLESGNHVLTLVYEDGRVSTNFNISNETQTDTNNPQTGDNIYIYIILLFVSLSGMIFLGKKIIKFN